MTSHFVLCTSPSTQVNPPRLLLYKPWEYAEDTEDLGVQQVCGVHDVMFCMCVLLHCYCRCMGTSVRLFPFAFALHIISKKRRCTAALSPSYFLTLYLIPHCAFLRITQVFSEVGEVMKYVKTLRGEVRKLHATIRALNHVQGK